MSQGCIITATSIMLAMVCAMRVVILPNDVSTLLYTSHRCGYLMEASVCGYLMEARLVCVATSWRLVCVATSWRLVCVATSWRLVCVATSWRLVSVATSWRLVCVATSWRLVCAAVFLSLCEPCSYDEATMHYHNAAIPGRGQKITSETSTSMASLSGHLHLQGCTCLCDLQ